MRLVVDLPDRPDLRGDQGEVLGPAGRAVRGRAALVAIQDGSQEIVLDAATGRPRSGPVDLGFEPVRPVQYADLDGDGEPESLVLGPGRRPTSNR